MARGLGVRERYIYGRTSLFLGYRGAGTEISSEIENRARAKLAVLAGEGVRASLDFSQNQKSRRGELF